MKKDIWNREITEGEISEFMYSILGGACTKYCCDERCDPLRAPTKKKVDCFRKLIKEGKINEDEVTYEIKKGTLLGVMGKKCYWCFMEATYGEHCSVDKMLQCYRKMTDKDWEDLRKSPSPW